MKKCLNWMVISLVVAALCLLLYWWALAPLVSRFIPRDHCVYRGLKFYENDAYLEFENGKDFRRMLSEYCTGVEFDAIDFYYVDNYIEDNPLRGKMCDVYALDVKYSDAAFAVAKQKVLGNGTSKYIHGDFELCSIPFDPSLGELVYVIGVCEEAQIMRYLLITEFDDANDFSGVFSLHTNLEWEIPE